MNEARMKTIQERENRIKLLRERKERRESEQERLDPGRQERIKKLKELVVRKWSEGKDQVEDQVMAKVRDD